jgi:hypothetical protein
MANFQSNQPVDLPLAEDATATSEGEFVMVTFVARADDGRPLQIRVPLNYEAAEKLHAQLTPAARMAKVRFERRNQP